MVPSVLRAASVMGGMRLYFTKFQTWSRTNFLDTNDFAKDGNHIQLGKERGMNRQNVDQGIMLRTNTSYQALYQAIRTSCSSLRKDMHNVCGIWSVQVKLYGLSS